jgi:hypothetical protein
VPCTPDLAVPAQHGQQQLADDVLHGPTDRCPNLDASLPEPPVDDDDRGEGRGGEGELLPRAAGGTEEDDGRSISKGSRLRRGAEVSGWPLH